MSEPPSSPTLARTAPKPLPVFGHLLEFARAPLEFLTETARAHGPFVRLSLLGKRVYLVSSPELVERVLVKDAKRFKKDYFIDKLAEVLGRGLLTSEGDHWRRQRKLAQPAFQPRRVDAYAPAMARLTDELTARFRDGETRDLHADMMAVTLDIVAETLFGAVVRDDAQVVAHAVEVIQQRYDGVLGSGILLDLRIPLPIHLRMKRLLAQVDRMLYRVIDARRAAPEDRGDLLATFLASRDEAGRGMTDEQLRDEAITLFMAGHETTALTLTYAFRLLTQHPAVEAKLHEELDRVLGGRAPTREDADRLPYTEAVVKEALRLYPPAWTLGREVLEPTTLGDVTLEPGDMVVMSQWVVHRDPSLFPEPTVFRPERWLGDETRALPKLAFFPFGAGPRVCIGNQFAMLEAVVVLAAIARRHRIVVDLDAPFGLTPSITLRPSGPVPARIHRRSEQGVAPRDGAHAG